MPRERKEWEEEKQTDDPPACREHRAVGAVGQRSETATRPAPRRTSARSGCAGVRTSKTHAISAMATTARGIIMSNRISSPPEPVAPKSLALPLSQPVYTALMHGREHVHARPHSRARRTAVSNDVLDEVLSRHRRPAIAVTVMSSVSSWRRNARGRTDAELLGQPPATARYLAVPVDRASLSVRPRPQPRCTRCSASSPRAPARRPSRHRHERTNQHVLDKVLTLVIPHEVGNQLLHLVSPMRCAHPACALAPL